MAKKSRFKLVMLCTEGSKKRWGGELKAQFFSPPPGRLSPPSEDISKKNSPPPGRNPETATELTDSTLNGVAIKENGWKS